MIAFLSDITFLEVAIALIAVGVAERLLGAVRVRRAARG